MALIKCPDCGRKVSDKADACPKCSFPIRDYKPTQEEINLVSEEKAAKKKQIKKWLIIIVAIITSFCVIIGGIGIGMEIYDWYEDEQEKQEEQEFLKKYPLFHRSRILNVDPYGLSNENSVIDKKITDILVDGDYVENVDYTISAQKDDVLYTFSLPNYEGYYDDYDYYPMGNDVKLVLHTLKDVVFKVEYTFRIECDGPKERRNFSITLNYEKDELTHYYDVDPIYCGYNYSDDEFVFMTNSEYTERKDYYDVTFISWKNEKGTATFSFTNMFEEKPEYGSITFTKDENKENEYQDYTDKYNSAV